MFIMGALYKRKVMEMKRQYRDIFINEEIFSDFYFFNIGHEICSSNHSYGPNMRQSYVVHFVVSGRGTFRTRKQTYLLKKGNFFLIRPNELIYYEADKTNPWEYYWLGFDGEKVIEILRSRFIGEQSDIGVFNMETHQVKRIFEDLIDAAHFENSQILSRYSSFFEIMNSLNGGVSVSKGAGSELMKRKYSQAFMLYVHNSYHLKELSIAGIANSMNLNPSYLSQVIKEELGVSPISYLKAFRLQKASVLLEVGNITVSEVVDLVGYSSLQSFSRAFKQQFGQTPSKYKGQH